MSTIQVEALPRPARTARVRPAQAAFIERTGAFPLVVTVLVLVITAPLLVLEPLTLLPATTLLAAGAGYHVAARLMRRGEGRAAGAAGLAAAAGLSAIVMSCVTMHHVAEGFESASAVAPCCAVALAVPAAVWLGAVLVAWSAPVRRYVGR